MSTKGIKKSSNKKLLLQSISVRNILKAGKIFLSNDPYGLIKNKLEIKNWVKNNKLNEINSLPKDERSNLN